MAVDTGQARLVSLRVAPERAGGGALAVAHSLPVADPEEEAPTLTNPNPSFSPNPSSSPKDRTLTNPNQGAVGGLLAAAAALAGRLPATARRVQLVRVGVSRTLTLTLTL